MSAEAAAGAGSSSGGGRDLKRAVAFLTLEK